MLIGVDFDNTIVRCDELFYRAARDQGLIASDVPISKEKVRDSLRACGREDSWTELQGYVYGVLVRQASPFPGVREFFTGCRHRGIRLAIISHKTRHPFLGPHYDLHAAAQEFLHRNGFYDPAGIGLSASDVFFELSKTDKLTRIAREGCTHFIDDLPEFLAEPAFPAAAEKILFDPNRHHADGRQYRRATSWEEIFQWVVGHS